MVGTTTDKTSRRFKLTRHHHSLESAQDYTELVFDLIENQGEARIGQLAKALGVSHVTALRTVQRLQKQGYLETSYQKPIQLTEQGYKLAVQAKYRHELLVKFLQAIGVSRNVAEIDAEGAEHHFSAESFEMMEKFLKPKKKGRVVS